MHRQWLLGTILAGLAVAQTQVDLGKQSKDVDFSQASSTRPLKSGTTLPSSCTVGQMFYLTSTIAGANLYACTATNTWSVEGSGSSAQGANQLTDLQPVRTSSTVLTMGQYCSASAPCNVALNGVTYEFTIPMTITNSASTGLTARGYVSDGSDGQSAGALVIANSAVSGLACSGGCVVVNNVSAFPVSAGVITEFSWTAAGTSGQWDVTGYTDWRPFQGGGNRLYSTNGNCNVAQSSAGTGLTCAVGIPVWSDLQSPTKITNVNMGSYASSFAWTDPANSNPNYQYGIANTFTFDANNTLPSGYNIATMFDHTYNYLWGQALCCAGGNSRKNSAMINNDTMNAIAGGQVIPNNYQVNSYGMGDTALQSVQMTCAGGPVGGGETSCGHSVVSRYQGLGQLAKTTIVSTPVRSACPSNMTLAQNVTASITLQTVTVSSSSGCQAGDWVVVDWLGALSGTGEYWDVIQLTGVGGGTITARFNANHNSGATVQADLVFAVNNPTYFGLDRVLVDESGASYSTGTVAFTNGTGAIAGAGTAWTAGMVGGTATNPGCIEAASNDQTYSPFGSGASALHSWWEIAAGSIGSGTSMGIYSSSVAGNAAYNGPSFGGSAYSVNPCGRVLMLSGNTVVLSPNSSTWSNGDTVELAQNPYPDVTTYHDIVSQYMPGGSYRGYWEVDNGGGQPVPCVICAVNYMAGNNGPSANAAFAALLQDGPNDNTRNPTLGWIYNQGSAAFQYGAFRFTSNPGFDQIMWGTYRSPVWVGTAVDGNLGAGGLELCGLGAGCMYGAQRNPSNSRTAGTFASTGGLQIAGSTGAAPAFFAIDTIPGSTKSELFLHGAFYSDLAGYQGAQYSDVGGGTGGFIMEYTDNGGASVPLYSMGGSGQNNGHAGFYVLPHNVSTSTNNYKSWELGMAASIWNGSGENPVWAYWDLEPDGNATNATTHAYLYGPCASPITNSCQYLAAGLDGLTVTGPATADYWASTLGTAIAAAATIAPTKYITHVTGTTAVTTITPPAACSGSGKSCTVVLIPDAANVYNTGGNIANALTATVNVPVLAVYDNTTGKWYLR